MPPKLKRARLSQEDVEARQPALADVVAFCMEHGLGGKAGLKKHMATASQEARARAEAVPWHAVRDGIAKVKSAGPLKKKKGGDDDE